MLVPQILQVIITSSETTTIYMAVYTGRFIHIHKMSKQLRFRNVSNNNFRNIVSGGSGIQIPLVYELLGLKLMNYHMLKYILERKIQEYRK